MARPVGIILIVLGVIGLYFGVVGTTRKTAEMNIGGIEASASEHRTNPALAIVGGLFVVGGITLMARGGRKA